MIGETLGSYTILSPLGEGGMGQVFVAEHHLMRRKAAVKVLRAELSEDQTVVDRFFNEARTTSLIRHPGLVDIFDFGYHKDGSAYIVMELLEGESLELRLRPKRPLPISLALEIGRQVGNAISAAHGKGIIHRDLKPDNILLVADPELPAGLRAKVLDFGIAKLVDESPAGKRTGTFAFLGTPVYMSPEQCRHAGQVDLRTDIYSLGCVLFEMVCGRRVFFGESMFDFMNAHMKDAPPAPRSLNGSIPDWLEDVILRALEKDPDRRFQTMGELVSALEQKREGTDMMWKAPSGKAPARSGPTARNPPVAAPPGRAAPSRGPREPGTTTTLGGATGERETVASPRRPGRAGIFAAIAVAAGVAGALSIVAVRRSAPSGPGPGEGPGTAAEEPVAAVKEAAGAKTAA